MDSRLLPNTGETQVKGNTKLKVPHSEKPSFQFLDLVIWLESIRVVSEAFAVSESALNFFSVVSANHMALSVFNPNINLSSLRRDIGCCTTWQTVGYDGSNSGNQALLSSSNYCGRIPKSDPINITVYERRHCLAYHQNCSGIFPGE